MAFKDLLLHIDTFPEATPPAAIDGAVSFAAAVGGALTALAVHVDVPLRSNRLADYLVGLSQIERDLEARSLDAARAGAGHFETAARAKGVLAEAIVTGADLYDAPELVASRARTRDLCLIPIGSRYDGQAELAQTVIFGSGRPVLVFQDGAEAFANGLRKVVVAWDGSRCAARAVAAALPLLVLAAEVRVFTVLDEKPAAAKGAAADLLRHLQVHGVAAAVDEPSVKGRRIGTALETYVDAQAPDLMVMGAYGQSRLREFVLGGATEHILRRPPVPTFLAH